MKRRGAVSGAGLFVTAATGAWIAAFSALSILRQLAFSTGRFDMGNMIQAVWSTAHGHPLRVTDLQGDQISRLAAHVDPILVLFAPLWRVWPSANMLLVAQALAVGLGAFPVYWLARKQLASAPAAVAFAIAYLLYPATGWFLYRSTNIITDANESNRRVRRGRAETRDFFLCVFLRPLRFYPVERHLKFVAL